MTSVLAALTVGGNEIGPYDVLAFLAIFAATGGTVGFVIFMLGLPGRIALARKHPEAEAVNVMGWAGFLAVVPWMQAFMWAFKPTDVVDVRRFPREEQAAEREELARLTGTPPPTRVDGP
jgi:membrane-bound ClpP family serine protease